MSMIARSTTHEHGTGEVTLYEIEDKSAGVAEPRGAKLKGYQIAVLETGEVTLEDGNGNIIASFKGTAPVYKEFIVPQGVHGGEDYIEVSSGKILANIRSGKATVTVYVIPD